MGGGGSRGGASEKMTPCASTMQHSLSSVSDHEKCVGQASQLHRRRQRQRQSRVKEQRWGIERGVTTTPGDRYITNTAGTDTKLLCLLTPYAVISLNKYVAAL